MKRHRTLLGKIKKNVNEEFIILKDKEELEKRLSGLLRIYRPEKEFAEDALTRSILDEFEYLKGRLPEKAKDV